MTQKPERMECPTCKAMALKIPTTGYVGGGEHSGFPVESFKYESTAELDAVREIINHIEGDNDTGKCWTCYDSFRPSGYGSGLVDAYREIITFIKQRWPEVTDGEK